LFGINGYEQGNIANIGGNFSQTEIREILFWRSFSLQILINL